MVYRLIWGEYGALDTKRVFYLEMTRFQFERGALYY